MYWISNNKSIPCSFIPSLPVSCCNLLQLAEVDQDQYKDFNMIVSERWQHEVAETVFDAINADTDKKKRSISDDTNHTGVWASTISSSLNIDKKINEKNKITYELLHLTG